jgi:cation diffusion facilitator CzcD-associated flavoprotein CzcO
MSDATTPAPTAGDGPDPRIVVIGAGPAGLTAAYQLSKAGVPSTILEADTIVGGISRTAERDGWRFDIGGHRFFTKGSPSRSSGTRSSPTTSSCSGPA